MGFRSSMTFPEGVNGQWQLSWARDSVNGGLGSVWLGSLTGKAVISEAGERADGGFFVRRLVLQARLGLVKRLSSRIGYSASI